MILIGSGRSSHCFGATGHRLAELAALDADRYVQDRAYEGRYLIQAAAQICIDLAQHLIASQGWTPAVEFREAFTRLAAHEVVEEELAARLQDLTASATDWCTFTTV